MDVREPGAGIGRDIAAGEAVEHELDTFIARRHEQRLKSELERELDAAWVEAERRQETLRRREMNRERLEWHRRLVRVHAARMKHHEAAADRLMQATNERRAA